jgi:asparagine synthase (glutamine-hydrolysing)
MPGIVGIICPVAIEKNRKDLERMIGSLYHEPFYSTGSFINEKIGFYVGWSCLPGSYSDCMPIWNENMDAMLFFYGEHHGEQGGRGETSKNSKDGSNPNARRVLRMIERDGREALKKVNGWFHGLYVDISKRSAMIFNDRFGMQRLYYYQDGEIFLFASEAKAILAVRKELRSMEDRSLGEYFTCGCVLENRTLFKNLVSLPGGSLLIFNEGRLDKEDHYFRPEEWEGQGILNNQHVYQQLSEEIKSIIARHLFSSQPIGISLSGGLDTRLIMACIEEPREKIPCYTFSGMDRESRDVKIARRVATLCGQKHEVLSLGRDFLSAYPNLAEKAVFISDGCLGAEGAYELYFNRMARQVAPVRITGNYGSEVFRRVRQLSAVYPHKELIHRDYSRYINQAMATFDEISRCPDLSFSVFRQAPWYGFGRMAVEQSQVAVRTPFMDNEFLRFMYQVPLSLRTTSDLELYLINEAYPGLLAIPTDRAERGRYGKMASPWAHALTWFIFKADYCYKSGMPQWLEQLHYWLGPMTPEKFIIGRHRFHYYRIWFRNELAPYIKDILLDPLTRQRPYINSRFLEKMIVRHLRGDRNYTDQIEQVLTLELIQRQFIERQY